MICHVMMSAVMRCNLNPGIRLVVDIHNGNDLLPTY